MTWQTWRWSKLRPQTDLEQIGAIFSTIFLGSSAFSFTFLLPTTFPVWTTLRLVVIMAFPIFFPLSLFCTELPRTEQTRRHRHIHFCDSNISFHVIFPETNVLFRQASSTPPSHLPLLPLHLHHCDQEWTDWPQETP